MSSDTTLDARPAVLVIAGSDSSGGAGVIRDVQTLTEFQVDACCAITAVTAQTHTQVTDIQHIAPHIVQQQIVAAFASRAIAAVKIGMLGTADTVNAVATGIPENVHIPIVLDPVLLSSSGGVLLDAQGVAALCQTLLPRATLVTPNIPELAALCNESTATDEDTLIAQARRLLALGAAAVLVKGGHGAGSESVDLLVTRHSPPLRLTATRVAARMRGTGCVLASAIAANLALGVSIADASELSKHFVLQQLRNS